MQHLLAYYESLGAGAFDANIDAVQDPQLFTEGDLVRIPPVVNRLGWTYTTVATDQFTSAELLSPSIRTRGGWNIFPINTGLVSDAFNVQNVRHVSGIQLDTNEALQMRLVGTTTGVRDAYGAVLIHDGNIDPVQGDMITVAATATVTNIAGTWVNGRITFERDLPVGVYDVVGLCAVGAGLVAARLVFTAGGMRPGVLGKAVLNAEESVFMRYGFYGIMGTFDTTAPPSVDCIGSSGAAQTFFLDLIRR